MSKQKIEILKEGIIAPNLKFYVDLLREMKLTNEISIVAHNEGLTFIGLRDSIDMFTDELDKHKEIKYKYIN